MNFKPAVATIVLLLSVAASPFAIAAVTAAEADSISSLLNNRHLQYQIVPRRSENDFSPATLAAEGIR